MSDRLFCAQIDPKIEAASPKFSSNLVAKSASPLYLKPKSPAINGLGESIVLFIKNVGMLLDRQKIKGEWAIGMGGAVVAI